MKSALIMTRALDFLQKKYNEGYILEKRGKFGEWEYYYDPKRIYEYVWVMLQSRLWPKVREAGFEVYCIPSDYLTMLLLTNTSMKST
jgi:hypothetical protein